MEKEKEISLPMKFNPGLQKFEPQLPLRKEKKKIRIKVKVSWFWILLLIFVLLFILFFLL